MMKKLSVATIVGAIVLLASVWSHAAKYTVPLTSEHISTHARTEQGLGAFFVATFPLPKEVVGADELYGAYQELVVDVDALAQDAATNEAPNFEVYALTEPFSSTVDPSAFGKAATGPVNIARGSGRRLVVDVTDIVRYYIENPSKNHGVVMGSFTGEGDGVFDLKTGPDGTLAKLIFHYRPDNR